MDYRRKGMASGLAGAFVLAGFFALNHEISLLPELDFAGLLGTLTGTGAVGGWLLHFMIGALWGGLFAWLDPDLPGDGLRQRGVIFALIPWFAMMFVLMPLAGHGVFGLGYGVVLPLAALALHVIFGAVMGGTYDWLLRQSVPLRYRQPPRRVVVRSVTAPAPVTQPIEMAGPAIVPEAPAPSAVNAAPLSRLKTVKAAPRRPTAAPATVADLKSRAMPANKPQPLPAKPAAAEPTVVTTAMLTRPLRRPKG